MTIKQKQWQLYFLGYYGGDIDGVWGAKSTAATKAFQKDNGLTVDGVFGAKTEAKTKEVIAAIQTAVGAYADDLAGSATVTATMAYQKANGLTADGIAGVKTRAKIAAGTADFWKTIKYFKKEEFACKCGGRYCNGYPVQINQTLVRVAERVRKHFGKAATVSSGIRCTQHNANVGGVTNSYHTFGEAMDFSVAGVSSATLLAYVQKQPEIGYAYAIDSQFVHMDVR